MADCIHLLPNDVINQVAAGEVIERPAAVLKELIENSLDAGAKKISIQFRRAGKDAIEICDDGCGMSHNDALLAMQTHATSKIAHINDLHSIRSFGFRGEALPCIASISHFRLRTRRRQDPIGTEILIDGGQWISTGDCAMLPGTEIIVTQLFKNVPARRKFLKTDQTETNHLLKVSRLFALDFPSVQFSLVQDGRTSLKISGSGSSETRIRQLWGDAFWKNLVPIDRKNETCHLSGFVAHPGLQTLATPEMTFFVNRRAIEGGILRDWLLEVYRQYLPETRTVSCFLFFDLPPAWVDVNVHPTKREVRFSHREELKSFLQNAIHATLSTGNGRSPFSTPLPCPEEMEQDASRVAIFPIAAEAAKKCSHPMETGSDSAAFRGDAPPIASQNRGPLGKNFRGSSGLINPPLIPPLDKENSQPLPALAGGPATACKNNDKHSLPCDEFQLVRPQPFASDSPLRWVGKMNARCVIFASETGLLFFDMIHVRERIEFEKILREMDLESHQKLLLPLQITFNDRSGGEIHEMQRELGPLGFEFEPFGPKTWRITALPHWLTEKSGEAFLYDWLVLRRKKSQELHREYVAQLASSQLARATRPQSEAEVFDLLEKLFQCQIPVRSPRGKRTYFEIPYGDIQRRW